MVMVLHHSTARPGHGECNLSMGSVIGRELSVLELSPAPFMYAQVELAGLVWERGRLVSCSPMRNLTIYALLFRLSSRMSVCESWHQR